MLASDLIPILLSLVSAMLFGISVLMARFGLQYTNSRAGALASIGFSGIFYWLLFPFFLHEAPWSAENLVPFLAVFALIGLISPGLTLLLAFEANVRLGPTVSGTVASTSPLFAAASAVLVLGEQPTAPVVLGTLAIVAGVIALSWQRGRMRDWPFWALLLALGTAFFRGAAQMGTKMGFSIAPAPYTAALITFTVAFLALALADRFGGRPLPFHNLGRGMGWLMLTGVLNAVALVSMNLALQTGRVVVVSPMVSTFPLFTFALCLLLRYERLGLRILGGVVLVVAGVVAITLR